MLEAARQLEAMNRMTSLRPRKLLRIVLLSTLFPLCSGAVGRAAPQGVPANKDFNAPTPELLPMPGPPETRLNSAEEDARQEAERQSTGQRSASMLPTAPENACPLDAEAFCEGKTGHPLYLCLVDRFDDLSSTCIGLLRPYINARIAASCSGDARVLCFGAPTEGRRECLRERKSEAGVACQFALELWPAVLNKEPLRRPRPHKGKDTPPSDVGQGVTEAGVTP